MQAMSSGMSVLKNQSMCFTRTCGDVVVCIHDLLFQEMKVRWWKKLFESSSESWSIVVANNLKMSNRWLHVTILHASLNKWIHMDYFETKRAPKEKWFRPSCRILSEIKKKKKKKESWVMVLPEWLQLYNYIFQVQWSLRHKKYWIATGFLVEWHNGVTHVTKRIYIHEKFSQHKGNSDGDILHRQSSF